MPKHIYYSIFTFLILLSFSCNNNEVKNEKKLNVSEKQPTMKLNITEKIFLELKEQ